MARGDDLRRPLGPGRLRREAGRGRPVSRRHRRAPQARGAQAGRRPETTGRSPEGLDRRQGEGEGRRAAPRAEAIRLFRQGQQDQGYARYQEIVDKSITPHRGTATSRSSSGRGRNRPRGQRRARAGGIIPLSHVARSGVIYPVIPIPEPQERADVGRRGLQASPPEEGWRRRDRRGPELGYPGARPGQGIHRRVDRGRRPG